MSTDQRQHSQWLSDLHTTMRDPDHCDGYVSFLLDSPLLWHDERVVFPSTWECPGYKDPIPWGTY